MFGIFAGKVRHWKKCYSLYKPKSVAALNNFLRATVAPSAAGGEAPAQAPYFPLE